MLSALLRDESHARWMKDDDDDARTGTQNDHALVPLPSDEDRLRAMETETETETDASSSSMCIVRAPPREEHPCGTPEENRRALFARMEVIQRWPERV